MISKTLDRKARIWTYLLDDLQFTNVPQPLGLFQHTVANEEDTFRLLESVNRAMDDRAVSPEILRRQFQMYWPELDKKLSALPVSTDAFPKTRSVNDMFAEILELSRAGASSGQAIEQVRDMVLAMRDVLLAAQSARVTPVYAPRGFGTIRKSRFVDAFSRTVPNAARPAEKEEGEKKKKDEGS